MKGKGLSRILKAVRYDPRNVLYPFLFPRLLLKGIYLFNGNRFLLRPGARVETRGGTLQFGCFWPLWRSRGGIIVHEEGCLRISGKVVIGDGVILEVHRGATVEIGGGTFINPNSRLIALESVRIGGDCAVAWDVQIMDGDRHHLLDEGGRREKNTAPIWIGDHVWIGAGARILKGSRIGDGAVIGAGAVVSGSVSPASLVVGNPARMIREAVRWEK